MQKISSKDAAALLKQAGAAITTLVNENRNLKKEAEDRVRDVRVVKLAREMEEKGLMGEHDLEEKVAHLRKVDDLNVTEQAVKLAAPQGQGFGAVGEVDGEGSHAFVTFIQTGEDPR